MNVQGLKTRERKNRVVVVQSYCGGGGSRKVNSAVEEQHQESYLACIFTYTSVLQANTIKENGIEG